MDIEVYEQLTKYSHLLKLYFKVRAKGHTYELLKLCYKEIKSTVDCVHTYTCKYVLK